MFKVRTVTCRLQECSVLVKGRYQGDHYEYWDEKLKKRPNVRTSYGVEELRLWSLCKFFVEVNPNTAEFIRVMETRNAMYLPCNHASVAYGESVDVFS
jgi:hypothetical protein